MPQFRPLPSDIDLGSTLARRIFQLREFRNLTVRDLGKHSRLGLRRIEDIESGLETWLSATDRQLLAKALSVEPSMLQEVESRVARATDEQRLQEVCAQIEQSILHGNRDLECPRCGGTLKCSLQEALDIDGKPTQFAKAFCLKCPFILK